MPVYLGIDWSQAKHDAAFLNEAGAVVAQLTLSHRPEGFLQLDTTRQQLGVEAPECLVGLETAHNLLVDFLWIGTTRRLYVLPPKMVQRSRERYRQSGARSGSQRCLRHCRHSAHRPKSSPALVPRHAAYPSDSG